MRQTFEDMQSHERGLLGKLSGFLSERPVWVFVLFFAVQAILLSELLIAVQSYFLFGEFRSDWLTVGFVTLTSMSLLLGPLLGALVSRLRQRETRVRRSEQQLYNLFNLSPDPTWIIDGNHFAMCNRAAVEQLGFSSASVLQNLHPSTLSPPRQPDGEDSFSKAERMMAIAREQGVNRFEWMHRRANGETFLAEVTLAPVTFDQRDALYCIWRDISESRVLTERLAQSESLLHRLFETAQDGINIVDVETRRFVDANPRMLEMLGYSRDDFLKLTVRDIHPADRWEVISGVFAKHVQGMINFSENVPVQRADGSVFPADITGSLMEFAGRVHLVGFFRDTTRRQLMEEALLEKRRAEVAAEAKGQFLANMSHEIRTPLNGVLGMAQIGARESDPKRMQLAFERILESGRHLLNVVNDILDFSKLEAGKLRIEHRPLCLPEAVDAVVDLLRERILEKGLEFDMAWDPALPEWIMGDAMRLEQVLANLLSNAVKFTAQGSVSLHLVYRDGELHAQVRDTGIGISESQQQALFQPFHQADVSTTRHFGGTGLGLAISLSLAEQMAGRIELQSQPGKGSTFTLVLPLEPTQAPAECEAAAPAQAPDGTPRLQGVRLLVAEDVDINRMIIEELLGEEGAEVTLAEDGGEVVRLVRERGPKAFDVVLMDVQMPIIDGYEATRQILRLAPRLPVIGLTAHALEQEREQALQAGMSDHVTKPVDIDVLVAAIVRQLALGAAGKGKGG